MTYETTKIALLIGTGLAALIFSIVLFRPKVLSLALLVSIGFGIAGPLGARYLFGTGDDGAETQMLMGQAGFVPILMSLPALWVICGMAVWSFVEEMFTGMGTVGSGFFGGAADPTAKDVRRQQAASRPKPGQGFRPRTPR